MKDPVEKDEFIKSEIEKVQPLIRKLAKEDLLECVGEVMDEAELKQQSTSVFSKIFSIVMSVMMVIQVFNYATTGNQKAIKAKAV